jgi:glycosyltransferase involved in cell wall biosynthesis
MVNPRPVFPGNENNFPSKVFEYALSGCAILSSRVSGVEEVLGPAASYFDEGNFEASLGAKLCELAGTPRVELQRRGRVIQERVLAGFSWEAQAEHLASFLTRVGDSKKTRAP